MTHRIASIATAVCLLAGSTAFTPAFAHLPPPPPVAAPEAETVATGRVQQWLLNPNGEADGLLLADGTQVAFPPHLSAAVMQALRPGDTVQVRGWRAPQVPVVRMQSLSANGRSVIDEPPVPGMLPPRRDPAALSAMTADGRIERLLYNDLGDVHGALLADRTIVRFPPHIGAAYGAQLQPGAQLYARGWGTRGAQGTALEATGMGPTASAVREVFDGPRRGPGRGPAAPRPSVPAF